MVSWNAREVRPQASVNAQPEGGVALRRVQVELVGVLEALLVTVGE